MSLVAASVQSSYIPWRGYFDLIRQADVFVFLDSVQFTTQSWRTRNYLLTSNGTTLLSVPVHKKRAPVCDIEIDYTQNWRRRHLRTFAENYARAPFRNEVLEILQAAFDETPRLLMNLNRNLTRQLWDFAAAGADKVFVGDEELTSSQVTGANERLIALCRELGATTYLSGPSANAYIEPGLWLDNSIELRYIDYAYAPYKQQYEPFEPFVSIVDALANLGPGCLESLLQFTATDAERDPSGERVAADPVLPQNESA